MFTLDDSRVLRYDYPIHAKQTDGWECGDLAIAKALCLLNNQDPTSVNFALPHTLRLQTAKIILSGKESLYPTKKRTSRQTTYKQVTVDLVCHCKYHVVMKIVGKYFIKYVSAKLMQMRAKLMQMRMTLSIGYVQTVLIDFNIVIFHNFRLFQNLLNSCSCNYKKFQWSPKRFSKRSPVDVV